MQREVDSLATPLPIHILGVNEAGHESGIPAMIFGTTIPLLQDVPIVNAWASWHVTFRDVIVLDAENNTSFTYNLTEHNLSDSSSYAQLKGQLLEAAGITRPARWATRR